LDTWSKTLAKQLRAIRTVGLQAVNTTWCSMNGNHDFPVEKLVQLTGLKTVEVAELRVAPNASYDMGDEYNSNMKGSWRGGL
jgi:hypothetical protein